MEKLRLLLVAPVPPPYGGIANWTLLIKNYITSRDEVELIDVLNIAPKQRGLDGRTWFERYVVQGFQMLKQARILKKTIKEKKPSVVHLTTSGQFAIIRDILFLRICRRKKVRCVYHLHFGRVPDMKAADALEWRILRRAIRMSDTTIAIDAKTEDSLKQDFGEKICCIANPFDFSVLPENQNQTAQREVLFLGWCVKKKGIEELLEAWDHISKEFPDWNLRIVGPYQENYLQQLRKTYCFTNVVVDGEKAHDEAMELLNKAGIFILPSHTEGFPNVILEAMACHRPIVATGVGAIEEMLSVNCGVVIQPRDVQGIERALRMLIRDENLRNRIADNAFQRVQSKYAIHTIYKQYLEIWRWGNKHDSV